MVNSSVSVFYVTAAILLGINICSYMAYHELRKNIGEYMKAQLELTEDFDTRIRNLKTLLTVVSGQNGDLIKRIKKLEAELYSDEGIVRKLDYLNDQKSNTDSYLDLYERVDHLESEVEVLKGIEGIYDEFSFDDEEGEE